MDGTYTSGLIIHEGQLTYVEHDLDVLVDLGIWWNEKIRANVIKNVVRDLGQQMMEDITMYTKHIEHSIANPDVALQLQRNGEEVSMMKPTENSLPCMSMTEP